MKIKKLLSKLTDIIKVDYIVENYEGSVYKYRKWKSGKIEYWSQLERISEYTPSAVGNVYRTILLSGSFSSGVFTKTPNIIVTPYANTGVINITAKATSPTSYEFYGWAVNGSSRQFHFSIYAWQD